MDIAQFTANIAKYAKPVDEAAVAGIAKHLGIALRNRDSSLVSATDPSELERVRESWLKKKLARKESDSDLDKAIAAVMAKMKDEHAKHRVTVYYLLAEHFKQLVALHPKAKA